MSIFEVPNHNCLMSLVIAVSRVCERLEPTKRMYGTEETFFSTSGRQQEIRSTEMLTSLPKDIGLNAMVAKT